MATPTKMPKMDDVSSPTPNDLVRNAWLGETQGNGPPRKSIVDGKAQEAEGLDPNKRVRDAWLDRLQHRKLSGQGNLGIDDVVKTGKRKDHGQDGQSSAPKKPKRTAPAHRSSGEEEEEEEDDDDDGRITHWQ